MKTYKIITEEIDYSIEDEDVWCEVAENFPDVEEGTEEFEKLIESEIESIKEELPQELELEITCDEDDLDYLVSEAVSDETGWLTNGVNYKIISVK